MSKKRDPKNRNIGLTVVVLIAIGLLLLSGSNKSNLPVNSQDSLSSIVCRSSPETMIRPSGQTHERAIG